MWKDSVLKYFPASIKTVLEALPSGLPVEEIRFRYAKKVQVVFGGQDTLLPYCPDGEDMAKLLESFTKHSLYAYEDEMKNGFITLDGGNRVGLCGKSVIKEGKHFAFVRISSFALRIAREVEGCADEVMPYLMQEGRLLSTLIVSEPGEGKTTLLRDIARQLSNGTLYRPFKVALIDERYELASDVTAYRCPNVGERTDVISGCPKTTAMLLAIRTLSPEVIVTDELGGKDELAAVCEAQACGVKVVASAHGNNLERLRLRLNKGSARCEEIFDRVLFLTREKNSNKLSFERYGAVNNSFIRKE